MGRIYVVSFRDVSVSLDQELFYIAPADDKPVALHGFSLSNVGIAADVGDVSEEMIGLAVIRGHSTVGSGGGAFTPIPNNPNDAAAGATCRINDTTLATSGTPVSLWEDGWSNRAPFIKEWTPETRPLVSQAAGTTIVIRLINDLTDATDLSGACVFEELI